MTRAHGIAQQCRITPRAVSPRLPQTTSRATASPSGPRKLRDMVIQYRLPFLHARMSTRLFSETLNECLDVLESRQRWRTHNVTRQTPPDIVETLRYSSQTVLFVTSPPLPPRRLPWRVTNRTFPICDAPSPPPTLLAPSLDGSQTGHLQSFAYRLHIILHDVCGRLGWLTRFSAVKAQGRA